MVTKPYAEDDDAPTLQRAVSPSGICEAVAAVALDELCDSGFEDEATTAVDKVPMGALEVSPADAESTTAMLPVDMEAVLRMAAAQSEPPPSPLGEDEQT